jgi:hypothetical protein
MHGDTSQAKFIVSPTVKTTSKDVLKPGENETMDMDAPSDSKM